MNYPTGKGIFGWKLDYMAGGDPVVMAEKAVAAGFAWVAIKVQGWASVYQPSLLAPAIRELKTRGIKVWGWGYLVGANSAGVSIAAAEAATTIKVMRDYLLEGFLIDAEAEYKRPGASAWAKTYITAIRAAMPEVPLGLCSYRFPNVHPELPWSTFLAGCDFHCPQVYWEGAHNPCVQLTTSVTQLKALKDLPIIPAGSAYARGDWAPAVADLDAFDACAKDLQLPGVTWWSFQHAEKVPEWWSAISAHTWEVPLPPLPKVVEVLSTNGIPVREKPNGKYTGLLPPGAMLAVTDATEDANERVWYQAGTVWLPAASVAVVE